MAIAVSAHLPGGKSKTQKKREEKRNKYETIASVKTNLTGLCFAKFFNKVRASFNVDGRVRKSFLFLYYRSVPRIFLPK